MGEYKVYLGNIPDDTRDRDVEKLFKGYGRIRNVVIKVSHNYNWLMDRKLNVVFCILSQTSTNSPRQRR